MDATTMRRRVTEAPVGRLATVTPGGTPHLVPCCFALAVARDVVYSAVDAKPKSTLALRRLDNLRAHPVASLLVDHYDDDWSTLWWVRVDGRGRVLDPGPGPDPGSGSGSGSEHTDALDLLAAKYHQYRTHRPPGAVIALDITTWRSWEASSSAVTPWSGRR